MNSDEEIRLWKSYFKDPEYLDYIINPCKAYDQNLILDIQGNVKFCFNMTLNPLNRIGNILTDSLNDIWSGIEALKIKDEMRRCNRACGVMACHINTEYRK